MAPTRTASAPLLRPASDRPLRPAGGGPPDTTDATHHVAGAARIAGATAQSAACTRAPTATPHGAGDDPRAEVAVAFASGRQQLARAIAKKLWPDGKPLGRGHAAPYLQPLFAAAIAHGRKTMEGRPGGGWIQPGSGRVLAPDDYMVGAPRGREHRPEPTPATAR